MSDPRSRRNTLVFAVLLVAAFSHSSAILGADEYGGNDPRLKPGAPAAAAAQTTGKKPLTLDDYGKWSRITSTAISPDGAWIAYATSPNKGETKLFLKNPETGKTYETTGGNRPAFSDDSAWAACLISPSDEERERLQKGNQPVVIKAELRNLATGDTIRYDNAQSIDFTPGGAFFTVKKAKILKEAKHGGTDLILRNLKTGTEENIGNVGGFAVSKPGTRLAYTVDAADQAGNGLVLLALGTGVRTVVSSGPADYAQLAWDDAGTALAVLKGTKKKGFVQKENVLIAVLIADGDEGKSEPKVVIYDPAADKAFPAGLVLSELGSLRWNKPATRIFLGIKENEAEPERDKDKDKDKDKAKPAAANVDVWHYADEQIQSVQMQRAAQERNRTWASVVHLDPLKFVRLADDSMRQVLPNEDGTVVVGSDPKPYLSDLNWGGAPTDYYLVDTATGQRTPFEKKIARNMGSSPDGRWFLYLKDKQVWAVQLATGKKTNLTAAAGVSFIDIEDDHPYELPTYGVAGWAKDGTAVILNHQFDLYSLPLAGGKPANITAGIGTKEQIRFRYLPTDPEERFIDTSKPLLLTAFAERSKASGFARLDPGGKPVRILFGDRTYGRPAKAKSADRFLFSSGTFVEFGDYYVSDGTFASPKKVTDANPQQAEFAWGSRTLLEFKNRKGQRLQAVLTLPANYEKGKRYPMIVYFYERLSDTFHQYSMPTYDDRPHFSFYASNGYLVLQPDIVYEIGKPGTSALDCVTNAARAAIELGYADPKHIGIQGHSWGGYETSFIATQTDMFACVVTGAPPTNLISFYDELYKSTGTNQSGITEHGQVRMGVSPWDNFKLYEDQSAITSAPNIKAPILILHGTADGAVDWHQGLELYNAGRRLGKKIILLSYPDEQHHLTKKENQIDFQVRMREFFDHYLKGAPAADWIAKGVPFLKKKS